MTGLLTRFQQRDRSALARILTHVENQTELGTTALQSLSRDAGHAHLIGLTGPPGSGKSTLANALVRELRARGRTVAVLAIDPSSPFSGGATLGDRIRMLESQEDRGVFIRSMASRGQVGGLAIAAFGAAVVLDSYGFDVVLIETVGTGQDEVDIASLADSVVLLQTPGQGDSIQAVKAGVLEIADVLVVNKADQPGAEDLVNDLKQMLRFGEHTAWDPPLLPVTATSATGVDDLLNEVDRHRVHLFESESLQARRTARVNQHARMLALGRLNSWMIERQDDRDSDEDDPVALANKLLDEFVGRCGAPDDGTGS